MDVKTRRVEVGGIASSANGLWMTQIARNLTDAVDGFFAGKRYLIHDTDPLYTKDFLAVLAGSGIESVKLPPRSPNLNEYAERFVRTIKEGCLEQMILFGEESLRHAIRAFVAHYHLERNHQGLANQLIIRSRGKKDRNLDKCNNSLGRWSFAPLVHIRRRRPHRPSTAVGNCGIPQRRFRALSVSC